MRPHFFLFSACLLDTVDCRRPNNFVPNVSKICANVSDQSSICNFKSTWARRRLSEVSVLGSLDRHNGVIRRAGSVAAVDNCKEGAASPPASRDDQPRQRRGSGGASRRRSGGSIDAINRVIKATGVKSFELVETDEPPVMERKSSAKLE